MPPDWPWADHSTVIRNRPHEWHVQCVGSGPELLLLHGTGASTHSWRDLISILSKSYRVIALDLPGHGFTSLGSRMRSSMDCVSQDIAGLIRAQGWQPKAIAGHSAGVAIALRLASLLDNDAKIVGINPALQPFQGLAGLMFPMAARMMAMTPGMVDILTKSMAQPDRVLSLLAGTGSDIPSSNKDLYARLFRKRSHVDGTLLMMAQWKLDGLLSDLGRLEHPCLFLTGSNDKMVSPVGAVEAADRMVNAQVISLDGYGHLVHEEVPDVVADYIQRWLTANDI
ncbi:alpha/beta fold hydrolase BchO [Thalassococcus lentus]|uniref:Alpha/beta fold hydrolase n=1 Tax=Thalassococcus lentus TaxID=1210524 RepID=A0ABT4XN82_9RHOB|nr:alpha/beta fold hydrolase BchO [Thalassococcus lentus]MDA7423390.1 alpha/beta fold hydrolase [Thalassococcus lentus]